jgi:hypothetical protein
VADTSYLRREVENYVRAQLAEEFGQHFTAEFLSLAPGGRHEFDAVAADRSVVASVKSASGLTAGGRVPSGKIKDCVAELYYLSLVEAPTRGSLQQNCQTATSVGDECIGWWRVRRAHLTMTTSGRARG